MTIHPDDPAIRKLLYSLYREFFDLAEKKRRWSVVDDIPWEQVNRQPNAAIADVIETFCAVEMYLPDYVSKALPMIRANRGWAWFHANWGYEESKHSLALGDWLLKSGARTDEQMYDLEQRVFTQEWNPPLDNAQGMLVYAMAQELATWLHYRNLRVHVQIHDDPALSQLLNLIAIDERAHHAFYLRVTQLFLEIDREGTLEQLRRVLLGFSMPAVHMLSESAARVAKIQSLGIFSQEIFLRDVFQPILTQLGITSRDMRTASIRKSIA